MELFFMFEQLMFPGEFPQKPNCSTFLGARNVAKEHALKNNY
jgi:hypothetical protein